MPEKKQPDKVKPLPLRRLPPDATVVCQRVIRDPLNHKNNLAKGDSLSQAQLNAIGQKKVLNLIEAGVLAILAATPEEATEIKNEDSPPTSPPSTDPAASVTSQPPSDDSPSTEADETETDDSPGA